MRITADKPGAISFTAKLSSIQKNSKTAVSADGELVLSGKAPGQAGIPGATTFESRLAIRTRGGEVVPGTDSIKVSGADSATLLLAVETSFVDFQDVSADAPARAAKRLAKEKSRGFETMRAAHVAAHRKLFDRVSIDFGDTPASALPTDKRLKQFASGGEDPALAALYCQFGRYLMIASSQPGGPPPNLQGIWNDNPKPPWKSNYTIDMNLQMTYWPVEVLNLAECHEPLFTYLEGFAVTGARAAKAHWGANRGWVAHHNSEPTRSICSRLFPKPGRPEPSPACAPAAASKWTSPGRTGNSPRHASPPAEAVRSGSDTQTNPNPSPWCHRNPSRWTADSSEHIGGGRPRPPQRMGGGLRSMI